MSLSGIVPHESCRVCNKKGLETIISLGEQYIVNFLESTHQKAVKAPLDLVLCNKKNEGCGLLQLRHTVPGELLYKKFWYKSGVNQTMRNALSDITQSVQKILSLQPKDIVLDIGANDGTLLRSYKKEGLILIGFEPATNLLEDAREGTTKIINDFFCYESYQKEFPNQKVKVITSIAMFYDLEEPNNFVRDITKILDENGIWVIQMNYLTTMLENNAFDNIVHEHLEYYSLDSLKFLLEKHGLEVFDVELNNINGGSIRTYIKHKSCKKFEISDRVKKILDYETKIGIEGIESYHNFRSRIETLKNDTFNFIKNEVKKGKKIYVYGASTRGNTLLQYYGLDNNLITAAADKNPAKWGKKIVGTSIPIISEEQARIEKPAYFLVLPWYFFEEFVNREKDFLKTGGKFIVPLPELKIVG